MYRNNVMLPPAVILGGGANGYETLALLKEHNIKTILLTPDRLTDGRYPCDEMQICPNPKDFLSLTTYLNTTIALGSTAVLFPTSDEFSLFLASQRKELDKRFLFFEQDFSVIKALDDKYLFYRLCKHYNTLCPQTYVVSSLEECEKIKRIITYPCIIKPTIPRNLAKGISYKINTVNNAEELSISVSKMMSSDCFVIIQDMIPGGPDTISFVGGLYSEKSEPLKIFVGKKILQNPLWVGTTCSAVLNWNDDVVNLANSFLKKIRYTGLVDIEFKFDRRDNSYKIIEVNSRNGQWHRISSDGKWDISSYCYYYLIGNVSICEDYLPHENGRTWIYPYQHFMSLIELRGLVLGTGSWLKDMATIRLKCSWDLSDLHRCLRQTKSIIGRVRRLKLSTLAFGSRRLD